MPRIEKLAEENELSDAIRFVKDLGFVLPGVRAFGDLLTFGEHEFIQLDTATRQVAEYLKHRTPQRPLCLAVFGPPGSGKSFAVKQIEKAVKKVVPGTRLSSTTINLTQVASTRELSKALLNAKNGASENVVPLVFFDEFDAPRDGAPLGWLSWFLAPMQDGTFHVAGKEKELRRAIYVFAGGTSPQFRSFGAGGAEFVRAKGPDFVSRLRGFLDVEGPNAPPLSHRRAALLRHELKRFGANAELAPALLDAMLRVGRYRHGARSLCAVLDTISQTAASRISFEHLGTDHVLEMHADRGVLDEGVIRGYVALSGGSKIGDETQTSLVSPWTQIARMCWRHGATLAFGGSLQRGGLTEILQQEFAALPQALRRSGSDPRARLVVFPPTLPDAQNTIAPQMGQTGIVVKQVHGLVESDTPLLQSIHLASERKWLARVLVLFRMRLQVTESSVARIAIGGKTRGFSGRLPGVIEEVILALAQKQPVYIVGGYGHAAADCGQLLGLARPWTGVIPASLAQTAAPSRATLLEAVRQHLRPPGLRDLPVTASEAVEYLFEHAIGSQRWPDNGLTIAENRTLFASTTPEEIVELVRRGLSSRFADR